MSTSGAGTKISEKRTRLSKQINIFVLLTDAFGGFGGIAVYNRDVLTAMCKHPLVDEVVAIPRVAARKLEPMPQKLRYKTRAAKGIIAYMAVLARNLHKAAHSDVIYCAHINLVPLAWMIGKLFRVPVILAIYGIDAWQPTNRRLTNWMTRKIETVVSISEYTKAKFITWSGVSSENVRLLPNAIHLEQYGESSPSSEFIQRFGLNGKKVILTFGRIVSKQRAKGFDEVLEVMPELLSDIPDIAYVIAGDGDYRPVLEEKVKRLGLTGRVIFTGFVEESEKVSLYSAADVYVMPSRGEGFGFVFLEAMACGVPCVASSVDGSRDAVRDGKLGALVDPDDKTGLKKTILEALDKPREVPAGLEYFSFPKFTQRLHAIIDSTVAGGSAQKMPCPRGEK